MCIHEDTFDHPWAVVIIIIKVTVYNTQCHKKSIASDYSHCNHNKSRVQDQKYRAVDWFWSLLLGLDKLFIFFFYSPIFKIFLPIIHFKVSIFYLLAILQYLCHNLARMTLIPFTFTQWLSSNHYWNTFSGAWELKKKFVILIVRHIIVSTKFL